MDFSRYGEVVRVTGSLRSHLNLPVYHGTDPDVDEWIRENRIERVIVLLIDAMGTSILKRHLTENSFFLSHMLKSVSTVFPPTTSAATTAIRTGKMPVETGWLGWNQYFKEKDDNIILFMNRSQYGKKEYPGFSYSALPISFTEDEMKEQGCSLWPGWAENNACNTYEDMWKKLIQLDREEKYRYIYAYWDRLDSLMHVEGPGSDKTGRYLEEMDRITLAYAPELASHTGLVILADHSQIDVRDRDLEEHPALCECFRKLPALEPRTVSFCIHENRKKFFEKEFRRIYGNDFDLYTKEEVIERNMFGTGIPQERFPEFIGDYVAVAKNDVSLFCHRKKEVRGDHAGGREEEAMVPLILYTGGKG